MKKLLEILATIAALAFLAWIVGGGPAYAGGLRPHEGGRTVVIPQVPMSPELYRRPAHRPHVRQPTWGNILSPGVVQPRIVVRPPPVTIIIQPPQPRMELKGFLVCQHFSDGTKDCHFDPVYKHEGLE